MKRKRKAKGASTSDLPAKKQKCSEARAAPSAPPNNDINHPILSRYYIRVIPLRAYLSGKLQHDRLGKNARRRRAVDSFGKSLDLAGAQNEDPTSTPSLQAGVTLKVLKVLDEALVGVRSEADSTPNPVAVIEERRKDFELFSQQITATGGKESRSTCASSKSSQAGDVNDIVDFATWTLFNKAYKDHPRPPHMLCHGTTRASATWHNGRIANIHAIPGLIAAYPNEHAEALKSPVWQRILTLLGKDGERIMLDLILDCGLFLPIAGSTGSYYQLCGATLSELTTLPDAAITNKSGKQTHTSKIVISEENMEESQHRLIRRPSDIRFVRNRMLYARAALNSKGEAIFGLRHIHVLNRYSDASNPAHTAHVLKYVFPRQFGLHNVFTSRTDPRETVQPLHDYTLRETEIRKAELAKSLRRKREDGLPSLPRRLRGHAFELVKKMQRLHQRCSYSKLMAHYCPLPEALLELPALKSGSQAVQETRELPSFTRLATSQAQVSAYCRAVLKSIIPKDLLGEHNSSVLHNSVDLFIKGRRFETPTLDSVMTGMRVTGIAWLTPRGVDIAAAQSLSDTMKRKELLAELIYYIFDSVLMPLIRTNFHVTETSTHRNRLFYFRHDVWRRLTEPALISLKLNMFEEIGGQAAFRAMSKGTLGFSQVRLVPKDSGMRPITNLRRRVQIVQNGKKFMGRSINSLLAPAFTVLNLEKVLQSERLGASLFSVSEIYPKLRAFKEAILLQNGSLPRLFFVKVDVKSCFDSLPQQEVMKMIESLIQSESYSISKYAQIKTTEAGATEHSQWRPSKKFISRARRGAMDEDFDELLAAEGDSRRANRVFVDGVVPQSVSRKQILKLLEEHVRSNVVKIGKKYYRQKQGIAQGSVVSSLLCNLFYGDLEARHLTHLTPETSLLLRLIDDFLLITTSRQQATAFLQIMHAGLPDYGVTIAASKSLANFPVAVSGSPVPQAPTLSAFPYCGLHLDPRTLEISRQSGPATSAGVADGLSIERARAPGTALRRKTLAALRVHMTAMLLDTSNNRASTVWANVRAAMLETARRAAQYVRELGRGRRPRVEVLQRTVRELAGLAYAMMKSRRHRIKDPRYRCAVGWDAVQWITASAWLECLKGKEARFGGLIEWLGEFAREAEGGLKGRERALAEGMHRGDVGKTRGLRKPSATAT